MIFSVNAVYKGNLYEIFKEPCGRPFTSHPAGCQAPSGAPNHPAGRQPPSQPPNHPAGRPTTQPAAQPPSRPSNHSVPHSPPRLVAFPILCYYVDSNIRQTKKKRQGAQRALGKGIPKEEPWKKTRKRKPRRRTFQNLKEKEEPEGWILQKIFL